MSDFGDGGAALVAAQQEESVALRQATERERAMIESQLTIAMRRPRSDHAELYASAMKLCEQPSLAARALYAFPRGGSTVTGGTVGLARALKRCFGNVGSGVKILAVTEDEVHLGAWAMDMESNTLVQKEHRFRKAHQRKNRKTGETVWKKIEDERDLRELVGRQGSLLERNCIFELLPVDIVEDAKDSCQRTNERAAAGELKRSPEDTLKSLVTAYGRFGVTAEMIVRRLGHPLAEMSPEELDELRRIFKALAGGEAKRSEFFETTTVAPDSEPARARIDEGELTGKAREVVDAPSNPEPTDKPEPATAPEPAKKPRGGSAVQLGPGQRNKLARAIESTAGMSVEILFDIIADLRNVPDGAEFPEPPQLDPFADIEPKHFAALNVLEGEYKDVMAMLKDGSWSQYNEEGDGPPPADDQSPWAS